MFYVRRTGSLVRLVFLLQEINKNMANINVNLLILWYSEIGYNAFVQRSWRFGLLFWEDKQIVGKQMDPFTCPIGVERLWVLTYSFLDPK